MKYRFDFDRNKYSADIKHVNANNKGIQIYLDMTKDTAEDYESEFWTTINSIKKL